MGPSLKRLTSLAVVAVFLTAFALHPAVHAEDHGAHACLLSTTAPDQVVSPVLVARPVAVFWGAVLLILSSAPRPGVSRLPDARGPPAFPA
jgi:hypothetical protein